MLHREAPVISIGSSAKAVMPLAIHMFIEEEIQISTVPEQVDSAVEGLLTVVALVIMCSR